MFLSGSGGCKINLSSSTFDINRIITSTPATLLARQFQPSIPPSYDLPPPSSDHFCANQIFTKCSLSVSRSLNRTLVLPPFMCWCDQDQVATVLQTCASEGTDLELPFHCPADHFLHMPNVEKLAAPLRMSGFLRRPQVHITPDSVIIQERTISSMRQSSLIGDLC